ncbi:MULTISPECIES: hypothetical protein [Actinomycetes]|uniref:hypothetical protein n=1 Tax=Actinomycetes TaxID=1760 RepID=UPI0033C571EC
MKTGIKTSKLILVAAVAVAGLGMAPAAHSDAGEDLTSVLLNDYGNRDAYTYSWRSYGNKNVAVRDERADGVGVYSLYDRLNNSGLRLNNNRGQDTTEYSGSSTTNYVRKVTACLDARLLPDPCGPDDRPNDGR